MKLTKPNLFTLIWTAHLFFYYLSFVLFYRVASNDYEELYTILLGFSLGLLGWPIKQLPLFFIVPMIIMLILTKTKLQKKWFLAYSLSICLAYLTKYIWLFFKGKNNILLGYPEEVNTIFFIIPSLIISIICNWLIFKNQYKKFGV